MATKKAKKASRTPTPTPEGHCDVCGRKLPPRQGVRGRKPKRHKECVILKARLSELQSVLGMIRWAPPISKPGSVAVLGHAGDFKSTLHETWRNLTVKAKTATDDRNYYVPPGAGRKRKP